MDDGCRSAYDKHTKKRKTKVMTRPSIRVRGAKQNNLKNLDLDIPQNAITAVTGVSGSGKSSLAFDTLYAEGQRRYVETFSPYARQFMDRMDRPQVDRIEGIPPSIAIDRKDPVRTSRSTVGTMTELTDYVKLLFARLGQLHCRSCGKPVVADTAESIWSDLEKTAQGKEIVFTFPVVAKDKKACAARFKELIQSGFDRYYEKGQFETLLDHKDLGTETMNVLVDRVHLQPKEKKRVIDSLEQAFRFGPGRVDLWIRPRTHRSFSNTLACPQCNIGYNPPQTNLFSFNSPLGACENCRGFGRVIDIDLDLIIPDPTLCLEEGAIKPWGDWEGSRLEFEDLIDFCRVQGIPTDVPFQDLKKAHQRAIIEGTSDYYGVRGFFSWLETKTYKMHVRVFLSRYRSYRICPQCQGTRYKPEALLYHLGGKNIGDVYRANVNEAARFFKALPILDTDDASKLVQEEIQGRLRYLKDVGLGYLTLDRQSRTLSGGEVQRVALASALGSSLVNALYVLDEPSIGLHPRDNHRLIGILKGLRDLQNTVVVVEHDPEIISQSDYLLDLGPQAGEGGGRTMYFGPTASVNGSLTGQYLTGKKSIPVPKKRRRPEKEKWLTIEGAAEHNLQGIDVAIPLGLFVCLTGVSGSGKSTLAEDILFKAIKRLKWDPQGRPGRHRAITGGEHIIDTVLIDQRPIGRTPRANALTYTKAMDPIRKLMAATSKAQSAGYGPGHFSFNVAGGRCETCRGEGYEKIEMQFLSDVYVSCPDCSGKRFKKEILEVTFKGCDMHGILSMTVDEACRFFQEEKKVIMALQPLQEVGLGYIRLGQPINTFSGGEAQRLKLSRYLRSGGVEKRLFIFDEPTTGLHFEDINTLLVALQKLVEQGHTVFIIEHNMDVVKTADWVIDLGPEGGAGGGRVVATGPPEKIAITKDSHTGRFLRDYLKKTGRLARRVGAKKAKGSLRARRAGVSEPPPPHGKGLSPCKAPENTI